MLAFAVEEDFDHDIVRGLLRRLIDADLATVQDSGLSGADDPTVLEWSASEGRVLLSHDVNTMSKHAIDRIAEGLPCPGLLLVPRDVPLGTVIENLALICECCDPSELNRQIRYVPLR